MIFNAVFTAFKYCYRKCVAHITTYYNIYIQLKYYPEATDSTFRCVDNYNQFTNWMLCIYTLALVKKKFSNYVKTVLNRNFCKITIKQRETLYFYFITLIAIGKAIIQSFPTGEKKCPDQELNT